MAAWIRLTWSLEKIEANEVQREERERLGVFRGVLRQGRSRSGQLRGSISKAKLHLRMPQVPVDHREQIPLI